MATRQLRLLSPQEPTWKLDEHTKAVGRAGLARARQALGRHPALQGEPVPTPAPPERRSVDHARPTAA